MNTNGTGGERGFARFLPANSMEASAWEVRFFVYWRYSGHQKDDKAGKLWYNVR